MAHFTLMLSLFAQVCTFSKAISSMMSCPRSKVERKAMVRNQYNYFSSSDQDIKQERRMHRKQCHYTKLPNNKKAKWAVSSFPPKKAKGQSKIKLTPGYTCKDINHNLEKGNFSLLRESFFMRVIMFYKECTT